MSATTVDDEWSRYLLSMQQSTNLTLNNISNQLNKDIEVAASAKETAATSIPPPPPLCTDLNISTQTKVLFLNKQLDVEDIYWKIPIVDYWRPEGGVLKKTVKIVSLTKDAVTALETRLREIQCYKEDIIKQIDVQSTSRSRFKDERKITIGICKKDIMACRTKKKNVFYNCFSLVIRIGLDVRAPGAAPPTKIIQNSAHPPTREIHVKIFNTGKMEIPGILNEEIFIQSREMILKVLRPLLGEDCHYISGAAGNAAPSASVNVLINSNFNVGFFINRERLHHILRSEKYNLNSCYDPCTYPGVKCKFYYNYEFGLDRERQTGVIVDKGAKMKTIISEKKYLEISIMIFRTGSGLIVGNCSNEILQYVFEFITRLLHEEYYNICIAKSAPVEKQKTTKIRRKMIHIFPASVAASSV